ncbi:hypothetical protein J2Y69_000096 [Microbacterium resistens]|uniref:Secreted protein n=2 Tax=Microbacterium resistens TaxID=156977 RepID=A0ABU1S7C5_9MICO|nr:hypothetical protein [Microbacterium resistens]
MRRASASDSSPISSDQARQSLLLRSLVVGALAIAMMAGAPAVSFAADGVDDDDAGQLTLDTAVLVDDSVRAGSAGDFAIRGALFSADLSTRAHERREMLAERLQVVGTLDFVGTSSGAVDYQPVRTALFDEYSSVVLKPGQQDSEASPTFSGAAAVVAVPLVLVAGVLLGRFWARRRRSTS